jgi:hypothetical protein
MMKNGKLIKIEAAQWLHQFRRIEQITWAPGMPEIIVDKYVTDNGWFDRPGGRCLNLYRPPNVVLGDARKALPWLQHLVWLFSKADARHVLRWIAYRVQHPERKPNHALMLGGAQGIGKDTLLAPLRRAVGEWNFHDIQPSAFFETFNPFAKSVILRVNEMHDLGEAERINRFALYERTKIYAAAPPEGMRCHEKYLRPYYIPNAVGLLITSNHKSDGLHLDADDRRHYIAWSERTRQELTDERRNRIWRWFEQEGGFGHVAAYLKQYDLSSFDAFAPPPQTEAFHDIVAASVAPEDTDLADAIDALGNPTPPEALTIVDIAASPATAGMEWLTDHKARRAMRFRFDRCGYVICRNPNQKDGRWKIGGKNQVIYVQKELNARRKLKAAEARQRRG